LVTIVCENAELFDKTEMERHAMQTRRELEGVRQKMGDLEFMATP
jgi:hypothetical protein